MGGNGLISIPGESNHETCSTYAAYAANTPEAVPNAAVSAAGQKRNGKRKVLLGIAWCSASLVFGVQASIVGPTASVLAQRLHVDEPALGPVLGIGGICTLLSGIPSGWLLDAMPGNPLVAVAEFVMAAGYLCMIYSQSLMQLTLAYGIISLMFNLLNTGINVMVIWEFSDKREMGFLLNLVSATFGLGGMLAPQVVNLATVLGSGAWTYPITAAASALMALILVGLPSPKAPADTALVTARSAALDGTDEEQVMGSTQDGNLVLVRTPSGMILSEVRSARNSASGTQAAAAAASSTKHRPWSVLVPAMLLVFANVSIELGYAAWIYMYSKTITKAEDFKAESIVSTYWLAFTAMRTAGAPLAAFIHPSYILLFTMPAAILGSAYALVAPSMFATVSSVILVGIGAACGFPNTLSIAAEHATLDGALNGVISTVAGLAMTVMPSAVPMLARMDPSRGFAWLMISTLFMGLLQYGCLILMLLAGKQLQHKKPAPGQEDVSSRAGHVDNDLSAPLLVASEDH